MNTFNALWEKLRESKKYREEFVATHVKRSIPLQARTLMKAKGMKQPDLARAAGISQGVVSRAVDVGYGNLTLNTIIRLAAGFDVAFIGRFVPFSELAEWYSDLPNEHFDIPSFADEDKGHLERESAWSTALSEAASQILATLYLDPGRKLPPGLLSNQSRVRSGSDEQQPYRFQRKDEGAMPPDARSGSQRASANDQKGLAA